MVKIICLLIYCSLTELIAHPKRFLLPTGIEAKEALVLRYMYDRMACNLYSLDLESFV